MQRMSNLLAIKGAIFSETELEFDLLSTSPFVCLAKDDLKKPGSGKTAERADGKNWFTSVLMTRFSLYHTF
jgi:hypothetical protein